MRRCYYKSMLLSRAIRDGRELLNSIGVTDYSLGLDRAKRRAGCCHYSKRSITLSEHYVKLNEWPEVRNTILHEAAHALAGIDAGHGWRWAAKCRELGIKPQRCTDASAVMPEGTVAILCPTHGEVGRQHRMPKRNARSYLVCRQCHERLEYRRVA